MTAPTLAVIVQSGGYDRAHYALVLASAAAAVGRPAILFLTGRGLRALLPGAPGALDPADDGSPADERDRALGALGVATFETLVSACAELGVRFIACEMGLRAEALTPSDLRTDLDVEVAGVVTLLAEADGPILHV